MMKQYTKLPIPIDTAWDVPRYKWQRYMHWRIKEFFTSIYGLIQWLPTIWKDRHWDDYYITKMLQKKLEFQRAYLVHANRHEGIPSVNYWMTIVLNLIELDHENFYGLEYTNYHDKDMIINKDGSIHYTTHWEKYDEYLAKYPCAHRKILALNKKKKLSKHDSCILIGHHNEQKCRNLIFEILKRKSSHWWD